MVQGAYVSLIWHAYFDIVISTHKIILNPLHIIDSPYLNPKQPNILTPHHIQLLFLQLIYLIGC